MKSAQTFRHAILFFCLVGSAFAYSAQGKGNAKHDDQQSAPKQKQATKDAKTVVSKVQPAARPPRVVIKTTPNRPPGWDNGKKVGWGNGSVPPGHQKRNSAERQQQLIREQQQRLAVYRQGWTAQQVAAQQYAAQLQQNRRAAAYTYQQAYLARLQQQQNALRNNYNYNNDPYFYTSPSYSYMRGGTTYQVNQYGADQLRQAINSGYSEGFRSGQADQQDRYTSGYQNSYAYQNANVGYSGYSGDQDSYNYYFRRGFGKGYEDGYNSRSQYATHANGQYTVLGAVLSTILNLQNLR
jgi:hypothetical protein